MSLHATLAVQTRHGDGPPLLLIHGFTDSGASFDLLAPCLASPLVIPDLPGHGGSRPLPHMTLEALAESLVPVLHLHGPLSVVGHSMGAIVALHLAALHPGLVTCLTLIAGSLRPEGPELAALATEVAGLPDPLTPEDPFFAEWHRCAHPAPPPFLAGLAQSAATMRRCDWLDLIAALRAADLTSAAGRVQCPVTVIHGDQDPIFPLSHARKLADTLPRAVLRVVKGHGHNPHWENPGLIAKIIKAETEKAPR